MLKASNNLIKEIKKQKRENCYLLFLDNIKIIKDALSSGLKPIYVFTCDENLLDFNSPEFESKAFLVDKHTIDQLSDSKTPQGVVCIVEYLPHVVEKPLTNFLVVDGLQDPGNVGTLIRTATACGFNYVYLIDSVRVNNSKLLRSSVGTFFTCNVMELTREEFKILAKKWNLTLLKADMDGQNIFNFTANEKIGVVIGNEGQGVSKEISELCQLAVSIPMKNNVESLNAAISGSIIMYEISKNSF